MTRAKDDEEILHALEQYWQARKLCYTTGQSGITNAKFHLYELMDRLFGSFEEDPYHKIYEKIRKTNNDFR